jgi:hypothetical protein
MLPPEEFPDHRFVNTSLAEEHVEYAAAKEALQEIQIDFRKRDEPASGYEHTIGHQRFQAGWNLTRSP